MIDSRLRQREPRIRLPAWLEAARGEPCTMRHPEHCNGNPETVTAQHSDWDKPVGGKTDDTLVAFCCSACADWLDRTRDPDRLRMWLVAHGRTLRRLWEKGIIK
jgi:hypothetical protein